MNCIFCKCVGPFLIYDKNKHTSTTMTTNNILPLCQYINNDIGDLSCNSSVSCKFHELYAPIIDVFSLP